MSANLPVNVSTMSSLATIDVNSPDFIAVTDAVFSLGQREIGNAARIATSLSTREGSHDLENSPALEAMTKLREVFNELEPSKSIGGKVFGIIPVPFKRSLLNYLDKFKSNTELIDSLVSQMSSAQEQLGRDIEALTQIHQQAYSAYQNLEAIEHEMTFMLDAAKEALQNVEDAHKRDAIQANIIFQLERNLTNLQGQKAVTWQAMLNADGGRKMARALIQGCNEMKTMGASTLSIAVDMARAQGFQIKVTNALEAGRASINQMVLALSEMNKEQLERIVDYESKPLHDLKNLQAAITTSVQTIDKVQQARIVNSAKLADERMKLKGMMEQVNAQVAIGHDGVHAQLGMK